MTGRFLIRSALVLLAVANAIAAAVAKEPAPADAITRGLLRDAEFEQIEISPNGKLLAIARQTDGKSTVTLHHREDLSPVITYDPGAQGAITSLDWIDDERLIIGATRISPLDGFANFSPILLVVSVDGSKPFDLPGNFYSTIEGDKDHILVYTCGFGEGGGGCNVPEIRKSNLKRLVKRGELVMAGPKDTSLFSTEDGSAAVASKWEDDGTSKAYMRAGASEWKLINDGSKTGLEVWPVAIMRDGSAAYLQSQRKQGPDVIERYDFATGERTEVFRHTGSDPIRYIYSSDRKELVGALYEPTQPRYHFWRPDDERVRTITELQAAFPGKLVTPVSSSKDQNQTVLYVSSDREPGAFYLFDRVARKAKIIARTMPWLDPAKQAGQRGFSIKSRDGVDLHGLLTLPAGSPGKDLPLVVIPHGGPYEVTDVWGFDPEAQILAQHGYAVLQVNFRGSGGYGREFITKGERQWGRAMQDDVTDATRWAIGQGIADPARVCIYGVSYGGYAAMMGPIREPGLYRCAVGRSGVFDLSKMYKWGSIRRSDFGKAYLKRVLGEDPVELAAHSPVKLVEKIGVPVLLAHGARDALADVKHAKLLASELRKGRHRVELHEYSATGHYLVLERHRLDFYARLLGFLDENIGAKPALASASSAGAKP